MHIITAQEHKSGNTLYIMSDRVLWFKDNNNDKTTCCEVHLNNGETLKTKETASGIFNKMKEKH